MDTQTLARIETKLDLILMSVLGRTTQPHESLADGDTARDFFRQFTPKQNAALQMLMRGASNQEIAERMGVSVNTAKVHVRSIAAKLDVKSRASIAVVANRHWQEIDDEEYRLASGGLPKDWDKNWSEDDPLKGLYFSGVTANKVSGHEVTTSEARRHEKEQGDDVATGEKRGRVSRPGNARKGGRVKRKSEGIDGQE